MVHTLRHGVGFGPVRWIASEPRDPTDFNRPPGGCGTAFCVPSDEVYEVSNFTPRGENYLVRTGC